MKLYYVQLLYQSLTSNSQNFFKRISMSSSKIGTTQSLNQIRLNFKLIENNWDFVSFAAEHNLEDPCIMIEEQIRRHHGPVKNVTLFYDCQKKNRLVYSFDDLLKDKLFWKDSDGNLHQGQKKFSNENNAMEMNIYYQYDNAYQWPLLSF